MTHLLHSPALRIGLGLIVSAACLALAFGSVPMGELLSAIGHANYAWVALAMVLQVIVMAARAIRWRMILDCPVSFADVFWAQGIGLFGNNVLPLRAGEAARVVVLSQRGGVSWPRAAASVVLERALDVATILALLLSLLAFVPVPPLIMAGGVTLAAALAAAAITIAVLVALGPRAETLIVRLASLVPDRFRSRLIRIFIDLLSGFSVLRQPGATARILGWSVLTWAGSVVCFWMVIQAVVPGGTFVEASFSIAALAIGVSLPSSPGFVGVFQYVGQQALAQPFPDRYSLSSALAITLLAHLTYYLPTTALGALAIARLGLSVASLTRPPAQPAPSI